MMTATRTRAPSLHLVHAARTVVMARAEDGTLQVYVETPVGWRLRAPAGRRDGDLVVDPALSARLDAAVVAA